METKIIQILKSNSFNTVKESDMLCPICNGKLYTVYCWMDDVMDGNTVYYCENHVNHKFWRNAREMESILHLNKNASSTNFDTEQDFIL